MIRLENPIVEERRWLRPLLVPTLLELAQRNRSRQIEHVRVFEIARVFRRGEPGALPDERLHVGGVLVRGESRRLWESAELPPLFFEAKGIVQRVLEDVGRKPSFHTHAAEPFLHPGAACAVGAGDRTVGFLGEVHPEVAERFELGAPCAVFEVDLGAVLGVEAPPPTLREVSRHPAVRRDLAVVLAEEIPAGELLETIRKAGGTCLAEADIFDRYRGPGLPEGKISLGFRLLFQRADRTLTDGEVAGQMERIVQALARGFGATVR
jgi:phenylalanyl-tRNA synthetase beta chain